MPQSFHSVASYIKYLCTKIMTLLYSSIANTVSFNQSVYNVDEENEFVQITLVLSSSLPNDTIVQVISDTINATGM